LGVEMTAGTIALKGSWAAGLGVAFRNLFEREDEFVVAVGRGVSCHS
jgi:hypothetical protein